MIVRLACAEDAVAIATILKEIEWLTAVVTMSRADLEASIARKIGSCASDVSHMVLVAQRSSGDVVGYISVHWTPYLMLPGPEGYISELFVLERERGKGIGRTLLDEVKKLASQRDCFRLRLVTGKQRESYRFYLKLGWTERTEIADLVLLL